MALAGGFGRTVETYEQILVVSSAERSAGDPNQSFAFHLHLERIEPIAALIRLTARGSRL